MNNKFTFIHPTKCGGTAVEEFFKEHYPNYFNIGRHFFKCKNNNNSIIIFRDPIDRFKSIYNYWKSGSEKYMDNINKSKYTIKHFIFFLKTNNKILYNYYMWDIHYKPITYWLNNTYPKNIIVLNYKNNLNETIQELLKLLNIPNKNINLPFVNVSKNKKKIILDDEDIKFIKEYFKNDYDFQYLINNHKEIFRAVI